MKYLNKPILGTRLNWSHPLNKGLVGFWLFNEGHGDKVYDLSMNENTGTCTGMADPPTTTSGWNPGRIGPSICFDGSNDYILLSNNSNLNLTGNYTISSSFYSNDVTLFKMIVAKSEGGAVTCQYELGQNNGTAVFRVGNGISIRTASKSISNATWYNVVGVKYGTTLSIYVNGAKGTDDTTTSNATTTTSVVIGARNTSLLNAYFNGIVNEVRIWNRPLSELEIQQFYTEPYCMFI